MASTVAPAHQDLDFPFGEFRRFGSMDSLDTSVLDALAAGGDVIGSSLDDFMIGDPDHGGQDAAGKLCLGRSGDEQRGAGEANDDARLMELIEGLEPPDALCDAQSPRQHQQVPHRSSPPEQCSLAAACSPQRGQGLATERDLPSTTEEGPDAEQHQQQQPEAQQEQQQQQHLQNGHGPAYSGFFSMASCEGLGQTNAIRRTTSAAYPSATHPPSRFSTGYTSFVRHSSTDIPAPPVSSEAAPVRHVNSARERSSLLACRAASLPAAVLKSSGKLQHQPALRSPFETAAEGSDGWQEDASAVGATASVPDLSTMRLDSFHEARRAALAYISGDGGPMPSDTSTSGDSATLYKSGSVTLEKPGDRRHGMGHGGVHKDSDGVRRRSVRRASHIAHVAVTESEQRVKELSGQLEMAHAANAALTSRTQLLEKFMGLQESGQGAELTDAWWLDAVTRQMVEQRLNLGRALTFTLRAGHPISLTREQIASLPWTDFCKLWKDYMVVMAECLVEAAGVVASPPGQRLARLVYETGILRGCLQLDAPNHHNRLLCFLPDGEMRPPPPSAQRWATICTSLLLTQNQKTQLVQLRRMYLRALGKSLSRRRAALQHMNNAMPVCDGDEAGPDRFESTIEAVERLRAALRDEHSLLTQYKMIAWGRVFTPIQAALATVQAYPWTCDVPSIVNVVAASFGEPSSTELLLQAQQ